MKLIFTAGKETASISKWNGVIVLLPSGETGEIDVMFTGMSKNEKALFAKLVSGIKVDSKIGIRSYTSSGGVESGDGHDVDMVEHEFSGGLLRRWLYTSHHDQSSQWTTQPLGGIYYLTYHNGMHRVCGVDNPDMFYLFKHMHKDYIAKD